MRVSDGRGWSKPGTLPTGSDFLPDTDAQILLEMIAACPSDVTGSGVYRLHDRFLRRCRRHVKDVNHPDEHGISVRIPHVCDHVGRYCSKIGPKRKWELPRENMRLACRDEYSKRKYDKRCVACNEESIWGSLVRWRRRFVRYWLS